MKQSPDERLMKPYLKKLVREHRKLNKLIDTSKGFAKVEQIKQLKRMRLRLKDKIVALRRHYYGRSFSS